MTTGQKSLALLPHQSLPEYKNGRYRKLAIGTYFWHEPPTVYLKPYGGTWLGYTFGTVLILWLMLLGVRKRGYRFATGSLQGRTSAHVYIGTSLLVIVTLHTTFEFGWNVHTAAYALMVLVIDSGFIGVAYLHCPALMTANPGREQVKTIMQQIAGIDHKCRRMALACPTRSTRSS